MTPRQAWLIGACVSGTVTLHALFPAVLANYPERTCAGCDGYVAPLDCHDLGKRYELRLMGGSYMVQAADCATWQPPAARPMKAGLPWLGDVQDTIWRQAGAPMAPTPAMLCELAPMAWRKEADGFTGMNGLSRMAGR